MIQTPYLSAIVAMDTNRCIGKQGKIPWHCPQDLTRFKELTVGKVCVVGRKTYETLPTLKHRHLVVWENNKTIDDIMAEVSAAMALGKLHPEVMVIGGGQVYRALLPLCQRAYVTVLEGLQVSEGDAWFPELDPHSWELKSWNVDTTKEHGLIRYEIYERTNSK